MALKELLRPTRQKILIDFLISSIWVLLVFSVPYFGLEKVFSAYDWQSKAFSIAVNLAILLLFYYPASCGLAFLYGKVVKNASPDSSKKSIAAAVFFVIAANPLSFSLALMGVNYMGHEVVNRPCGVEVAGFTGNSPSRDSGMSAGETIMEVDGARIDTLDSLQHALEGKTAEDTVSVKTEKKEYMITLAENPVNRSPVLGVNVKQKYCAR